MMTSLTRRDVLRIATASGIVGWRQIAMTSPNPPSRAPTIRTRPIPRTQELLPTVGLGTWQAFDVDPARRAQQVEVVKRFLAVGGKVIDSSPMYGRAEEVVGAVLADLGAIGRAFLATKVWTRGKREGAAEMERSRRRMRAGSGLGKTSSRRTRRTLARNRSVSSSSATPAMTCPTATWTSRSASSRRGRPSWQCIAIRGG